MRRLLIAMAALLMIGSAAHAQSAPKKYLSTASNNSTLVLGRASYVNTILAVNTTDTVYYLKLYNKATTPTCGTDVPVLTIPVPATAASGGGVVSLPVSLGLSFSAGVGFCLVGGIADNDNSSAAAGVAINFGLTGR